MIKESIQKFVQDLMTCFPGSFINSHEELILDRRSNLYFRLENVETLEQLECKVIAWCSRAACKTAPYRFDWRNEQYNQKIREGINDFLGVDFSTDDWAHIYTLLGNDCNRELCEKFVRSDFDMNVLS